MGDTKEKRGIKVSPRFLLPWAGVNCVNSTILFKALMATKDIMADQNDFSIPLCFFYMHKLVGV